MLAAFRKPVFNRLKMMKCQKRLHRILKSNPTQYPSRPKLSPFNIIWLQLQLRKRHNSEISSFQCTERCNRNLICQRRFRKVSNLERSTWQELFFFYHLRFKWTTALTKQTLKSLFIQKLPAGSHKTKSCDLSRWKTSIEQSYDTTQSFGRNCFVRGGSCSLMKANN